jgi:hypothetical protein
LPADMFTHSRDGRQPAPEGLFAPTRQMLADGEYPDGGADALVRHHGTTTARSRLRSGVERVTHHDVASCQLQARTLEVAPEELKITPPRTGDRPRAGGRWDRAVAHGGVRLPAGCSGSVGGGTERGVRVAVGSPGRVAGSSRYPPGRVIGPRAHYPADRVTGTACYPCGRVTCGIGVTLQTRQPGNRVGWCYPVRAVPTPTPPRRWFTAASGAAHHTITAPRDPHATPSSPNAQSATEVTLPGPMGPTTVRDPDGPTPR